MNLNKQNSFTRTMRVKKNTEKMRLNKMSMDLKIKWKPKINQELT